MQALTSTYLVDGGSFGYMVDTDCGHHVKQDFVPGASGFVPMTDVEAASYAAALVAELEAAAAAEAPAS